MIWMGCYSWTTVSLFLAAVSFFAPMMVAAVVHFAYTLSYNDQRKSSESSVTDRETDRQAQYSTEVGRMDLFSQPGNAVGLFAALSVPQSLFIQEEELRLFRDEMTITLHE